MTFRIATTLMFLAGVGLLCCSLAMPYYKDGSSINSYPLDKDEYYKREAELRTNKTKVMDFGAGLAIASGTVLIFILVFGVRDISDFQGLTSMNRIMVFVSSNLVWLLLVPGAYVYYSFRAGRGDYPTVCR